MSRITWGAIFCAAGALCLLCANLLCWTSCSSACQTKATRCSGSLVELCGSNGKWQRVMDCSQIKPITPTAPKTWSCGQTTAGFTCLPK